MRLEPFPYCGFLHLFSFFNDTATTEIYPLSLHDALPISHRHREKERHHDDRLRSGRRAKSIDRKSTRLNSSHLVISYAVFCLKKQLHGASTTPTAPLPVPVRGGLVGAAPRRCRSWERTRRGPPVVRRTACLGHVFFFFNNAETQNPPPLPPPGPLRT